MEHELLEEGDLVVWRGPIETQTKLSEQLKGSYGAGGVSNYFSRDGWQVTKLHVDES